MEPSAAPIVSIVIPNFNRKDDIHFTLSELAKDPYPSVEIIVVDNGSSDGSLELIRREHPKVRLIALERNIGALARNRCDH